MLHQPRRKVDLVALDAIGAAGRGTVDPGVRLAKRDPDPHGADERELGRQAAKRLPGRDRATGIVDVGDRRAKGGVEVAALVANRHLDQRPFVSDEHLLHMADQRVEPRAGRVVTVVVDPVKGEKQRDSRAQLGDELVGTLAQPLVDCRPKPGPRCRRVNQRGEIGPGYWRGTGVQLGQHGESLPDAWIGAPLGNLSNGSERGGGRFVE